MFDNDHKNEMLMKDNLIEEMQLKLSEKNAALNEINKAKEELSKALSEKEEVYNALFHDNANLASQLEKIISRPLSQKEDSDALQIQVNDLASHKSLAKNGISRLRSLLDQARFSLKVVTDDLMSKIRVLEDKNGNNNAEAEALHLRNNLQLSSVEVQILNLDNDELRNKLLVIDYCNTLLRKYLPELDELSEDKDTLSVNPTLLARANAVPVAVRELPDIDIDLVCDGSTDAVLSTDPTYSSLFQHLRPFYQRDVFQDQLLLHFGKEAPEKEFGLPFHDLKNLKRELSDKIQSCNFRVALCEAEMSAAILRRDATLDASRLKSAAAFSAIEEFESEFIALKAWFDHFFFKNQMLEAKLSEMELAQDAATRTNYDLQMENHFLRQVMERREAKIHPLYIELKNMNAKLHRGIQQEAIAEISACRDDYNESISLPYHLQKKSHDTTAQPEDIESHRFDDLSSRHAMILQDLQDINVVICDALSGYKYNEPSDPLLGQDTLNTSVELERDLLLMEVEQRDKLLHMTSMKIDEIVKQLLSVTERLRQKELIVLLLAKHRECPENERIELSDSKALLASKAVNYDAGITLSDEVFHKDAFQGENSHLEETIRSLKAREDELNSSINNLQKEVRLAADEALDWRQRFLASDEKWSLKMESSKELFQCLVKVLSRALLVKQKKVARIGVAFGIWKTVATLSRDVRCTPLNLIDHNHNVASSNEVYPPTAESIVIAGESNSRASQPMNGDYNMQAQIKLAAARIVVRNMAKHILTAEARAFRVWSCVTSRNKAFSDHVGVAEQMANQLDATRLKLTLLRRHLEDTGIIQQTAITVKKSNRRLTGLS